MKKELKEGLVLDAENETLVPVDRNHYIQQWVYGSVEPYILKATNFMYEGPIRAKLYNKVALPKSMPRECVVTTEAAGRFVDFIYGTKYENKSARIAVTKCVCQTTAGVYKEPVEKDMALLYTANLYTNIPVEHNGVGLPYRLIETPEEAKAMLKEFDEKYGLVHTIMYCHTNGKWTFVICNCDDEICTPMRAYKGGRRDQLLKGPHVVSLDREKCEGCADCGKCVSRCMFGANFVDADGKSNVDITKCLGCGNCTATCPSGARTMKVRKDFEHVDKVTTKILIGEDE